MGAMSGNLDHRAELEAPSVRAGRFASPKSEKPHDSDDATHAH